MLDQSCADASLIIKGTLTDCGVDVDAEVPPPPPHAVTASAAAMLTAVRHEGGAQAARAARKLDVMSISGGYAQRVTEQYVQVAHSVNAPESQDLQTSTDLEMFAVKVHTELGSFDMCKVHSYSQGAGFRPLPVQRAWGPSWSCARACVLCFLPPPPMVPTPP